MKNSVISGKHYRIVFSPSGRESIWFPFSHYDRNAVCTVWIAVWNSRNHTWRGATNMLLQAQCNWHPGWQDNTVSTASLHWKSFSSNFQKANSCQQVGIQEIHSLSEQLSLSLWSTAHVQRHHTSLGTIGSLIVTKWCCSASTLLWPPTTTDWPAPTKPHSEFPIRGLWRLFPRCWTLPVLCSTCHCPLLWLFADTPSLALDEEVANGTVVQGDWSFHHWHHDTSDLVPKTAVVNGSASNWRYPQGAAVP